MCPDGATSHCQVEELRSQIELSSAFRCSELEGLLQLSGLIGGGEEEEDDDVDGQEEGSGGGGSGKVPRTIVHRQQPRQRGRVDGDLRGEGKSAEDEDEVDGEGGAFVLEGGHDRLASGGGIRGIRFLRKSQRA